jgi:uncharacterized membrane protein YfcA
MSSGIKKFFYKILTATIALAALGALVFYFFIPQHFAPVLPFLLLFFAVVTFLIHRWQLNVATKDMAKVTRSSMIATMLRLFLYSAVAIVYIAIESDNALVFVICLMIFYVVYTYIEIVDLTQLLRKRKK